MVTSETVYQCACIEVTSNNMGVDKRQHPSIRSEGSWWGASATSLRLNITHTLITKLNAFDERLIKVLTHPSGIFSGSCKTVEAPRRRAATRDPFLSSALAGTSEGKPHC